MSDAPLATEAPAGYRLGDPIELHDLLALPPDGQGYERDAEGRLALMSPDDARRHGHPLTTLTYLFARALDRPWHVLQERGIAFSPIYALTGRVLPPSRLGRKRLAPDLAVYASRPAFLEHRPGGASDYAPEGLRLVVEVLSPRTQNQDLGRGKADAVDRWRTYLANGVPEYWILNAGLQAAPLPPRSALFLTRAGASWAALPGPELQLAPPIPELDGLRPALGGRVRSAAAPDLELDLSAFWEEVGAVED